MIGFDLFLHAGLLARLYTKKSPFLLQADQAIITGDLSTLDRILQPDYEDSGIKFTATK